MPLRIQYNVNQVRVQRKLLFKIPISYIPPKDRKAFSENTEEKKKGKEIRFTITEKTTKSKEMIVISCRDKKKN